jgi:hypothetical protein
VSIRRLHDFADTCVFNKQSLGPILCGPLQLPPQVEFTYHGLPFSRSYGDILPSSFSADHSSTLGFSPRLRVSVYGTVTVQTPLRGFSRRSAPQPFAGSEDPFGIGARLTRGICLPGIAYHLASGRPSPDGYFAPASPLRVKRVHHGTGILTRFPSPTPLGLGLGTD